MNISTLPRELLLIILTEYVMQSQVCMNTLIIIRMLLRINSPDIHPRGCANRIMLDKIAILPAKKIRFFGKLMPFRRLGIYYLSHPGDAYITSFNNGKLYTFTLLTRYWTKKFKWYDSGNAIIVVNGKYITPESCPRSEIDDGMYIEYRGIKKILTSGIKRVNGRRIPRDYDGFAKIRFI